MNARPDRPHLYRCTFTLPPAMALALAEVAKALGISQSAIVAYVLEEPVARLAAMLADGVSGRGDVAMRSSGRSAELVREIIREALAAAPEPHPDLFE